jgi:hypothetical protein
VSLSKLCNGVQLRIGPCHHLPAADTSAFCVAVLQCSLHLKTKYVYIIDGNWFIKTMTEYRDSGELIPASATNCHIV